MDPETTSTPAAAEPSGELSLAAAGDLLDGILGTAKPVKKDAAAPKPAAAPKAEVQTETTDDEHEEIELPSYKAKLFDDDPDDREYTHKELRELGLKGRDYTTKTQKLADDRRKWESEEKPKFLESQKALHTRLTEATELVDALAGRVKEPDWTKLAETVPAEELVAQRNAWDQHKARVGEIIAKRDAAQKEFDEGQRTQYKAYLAAETEKLGAALPELLDEKKGPALFNEMAKFASSRGFSEDQLKAVADHRVLLLLHDAMQHQNSKAKLAELEAQLQTTEEASTPPSTGNKGKKAPPTQNQQARRALRTSGRLEDAGAAIEGLL